MFWFHGGSQTSWTSASSTPSIVKILLWASWAMAGPIPQPGAVNVIFTSTRVAIFFRDAGQTEVRRDGVTPAQRLRDHAGRSRRDRDLRSRRDLNRLDVAASAEFGVLVHISLRYYLNCRGLGCRCKLFATCRESFRGAQAASLQSSAACRRQPNADAFRQAAEKSRQAACAPQSQRMLGSSSSSITRFNKRPAPPPSRLR